MRDIKFRAWDGTVMFSVKMLTFPIEERDGCILMQFTGLEDKNGKEVYEGDIVKFPEAWNWTPKEIAIPTTFYQITEFDWADDCEVIGNIHENPELLKS